MEISEIKNRIEKARAALPEVSRKAIEAVDWKKIILDMREERKLSFSQIEALGNDTDLLLSGLLNSAEYPEKIKADLGLQNEEVMNLVDEMNEKIFKKIREELIKNVSSNENTKTENEHLESREELLKKIENPEKTPPILDQKLSKPFQMPPVKTEHTINNMTRGSGEEKIKIPKVDPYRMPIDD